ncbi:MAG: tandem-95 repeat protein, partial [Candidatus Tenebribacter mawsonii]|nr:tandem-95 repeat protein [Candidatus Tenebribacter mawsonii]
MVVDFSELVNDVDNVDLELSCAGNSEIDVEIDSMIVTFTASENWNGEEVLTFTVDDQQGRATAYDSLEVIVTPVNDPPEIELPESFSFNEDESLVVDFIPYINDNDGDGLILTSENSVDVIVTIEDHIVTFTASEDWNGVETIIFTVYDTETRLSASDSVNVIVEPVNDPPTIDLPDSFTFLEDESLEVDFSEFVDDVDNVDLLLTCEGNEEIGVEVDSLIVTFTAPVNWFGSELLTFTIDDQQGREIASDEVNIVVEAVNDPPTIELPDSFSFSEDESLEVDFTDYLSDIDGDELLLTVSDGDNIMAEITGFMVTFTAAENWSGEEVLTFTVDDQQGRAVAYDSVEVIVTPVNDPPEIELPESFSFNEDESVVVDFAPYINDIDGDGLILTSENSVNVIVTIEEHLVTFTASEDWNGIETIIFTVYDTEARLSASDSVNVIVEPVNDSPTIDLPDSFTVAEDSSLVVDFSYYVDDVDGDALTLGFAANEIMTFSFEGLSVTFGTLENWNGTILLTVTVDDQQGRATASDETTIIVTPVNDPPEIELPESFSFNEDESLVVDFTPYINDIDGNELIITSENSVNVIVTIEEHLVTFTASEDWNGEEVLTFTVDDQQGRAVASDDVNITVTPVNDPPEIELPDSFIFNEDESLDVDFEPYMFDIEGTDMILTVSMGNNVYVAIDGFMVTLTALENWNGEEELTFTVYDTEIRLSASDDVLIIVEPVNDSPTIDLPDSFLFSEDESLEVDFSEFVDDVDDVYLVLSCVGNLEIDVETDSLIVIFTATENWNGSELLTFTVDDQQGRATASDETTIIVTPVNDPPEIELPESFSFNEDESLEVDFTPYINDIDGDELIIGSENYEDVIVTIEEHIVTFTASEDWNGVETIIFTVYDTEARLSASDIVNVIVEAVNDPPVIDLPETFSFEEDTYLYVYFAFYIFDADGDEFELTADAHENIDIEINGFGVTFTPSTNWNGSEIITFTIN